MNVVPSKIPGGVATSGMPRRTVLIIGSMLLLGLALLGYSVTIFAARQRARITTSTGYGGAMHGPPARGSSVGPSADGPGGADLTAAQHATRAELPGASFDQSLSDVNDIGAFRHLGIAPKEPLKTVHWIPEYAGGATHGTVAWPSGALAGAPPGTPDVPPHDIRWRVLHPDQPRALYIESTVTPAEASNLVDLAKSHLERSRVIAKDGQEVSTIRTSSGVFLLGADSHHPANLALRMRARAVAGLQQDDWFESTQILRYMPGERYVPHPDFFGAGDHVNVDRGGQRIVTVLTWLNNVTSGGTTSFPMARPQSLVVSPHLGDSVLFYSVKPDGQVDMSSYHGGDPPGQGAEKWVAVLWGHLRTFV